MTPQEKNLGPDRLTYANCRPLCFWIGLISVLLYSVSSEGASRKGVQAVVLSRWSQSSVLNFETAIHESRIASLELEFCPFFSESDPFGNIQHIINSLPPKFLTLSIHLSGPSESLTLQQIAARARATSPFLLRNLSNLRTIKISPMLEDNFGKDTFRKSCIAIGNELDWQVVAADFQFRRSNNDGDMPSIVRVVRGSKFRDVQVQREVHGRNAGGHAWSNDGYFVYGMNLIPEEIETRSCTSCTPPTEGMSVGTFRKKSHSFSGAALLWRPAFNGWTRETFQQNGRTFARWVKPNLPANLRKDNGPEPWFGSNEKTVLLAFLRQ